MRLLVAIGVLVAAFLAVASAYRVDLAPPSVSQRTGVFGAAQTIVYVDTPRSSLVTSSDQFGTLTTRAHILAHLVESGEVRGHAARALGAGAADISVEGPLPDEPGRQNVQPAAQQRANSVLGQRSRYSVFVDTERNVPTITLFLQAPSGGEAVRLGAAMVDGLRAYVADLTRESRPGELLRIADEVRATEAQANRSLTAAERRQERRALLDKGMVIRSVGAPVGGDVRDRTGALVVVFVFVAAVAAWCIALVLGSSLVGALRRR